MPNELPPIPCIPPPDQAAHDDGVLMHDLTVLNAKLSRYVLRFLDADSQRATPDAPAAEIALANCLTNAANALRSRASRRTPLIPDSSHQPQ
ncbi:hypothetical protein BLA60_14890 [Actinophytocola xinjiangensis]|uniref:Uncharacterized protein n=1 Tax=Actinophytocola xinjiangensis TaxID=485602 RepID=A0A7Z0WLS6_9PSEU|nr:hypothetical protein BLA60_14890 [Actinophytocola xinjiangensis]